MLQLICNKGNCIIPRICATFLMNLSSSSFSLDENYWSFISSKQTEISKMKAFLLLLEKGFKTLALPLLVEKEYIWNTRKRSNHCGGFFINADSKNGCNTFSDSIFVNWLQRYSIFGQITRMKQFPFWKKKTTPASDASAISANIWKILQRQTNKHTLCKWLCGCKFWRKI